MMANSFRISFDLSLSWATCSGKLPLAVAGLLPDVEAVYAVFDVVCQASEFYHPFFPDIAASCAIRGLISNLGIDEVKLPLNGFSIKLKVPRFFSYHCQELRHGAAHNRANYRS